MTKKRKSCRELVEADIELLPLMSLFVVLIPMLLLSAVFLEISVIDLSLPEASEAVKSPAEPFTVTVAILDRAYVIRADGFPERVISREASNALKMLSEELAAVAARRPENTAVTLLSRPETRYEDIIAVMDVSREAGLSEISLSGDAS